MSPASTIGLLVNFELVWQLLIPVAHVTHLAYVADTLGDSPLVPELRVPARALVRLQRSHFLVPLGEHRCARPRAGDDHTFVLGRQ